MIDNVYVSVCERFMQWGGGMSVSRTSVLLTTQFYLLFENTFIEEETLGSCLASPRTCAHDGLYLQASYEHRQHGEVPPVDSPIPDRMSTEGERHGVGCAECLRSGPCNIGHLHKTRVRCGRQKQHEIFCFFLVTQFRPARAYPRRRRATLHRTH
jgi:hypothetical protein